MEAKELIELMIQERLGFYFKNNTENRQEELKKSDEFLLLLKEEAPHLEEAFLKYLDWTAERGGDEQEGLYLFGLSDGVRLMKDIFNMM